MCAGFSTIRSSSFALRMISSSYREVYGVGKTGENDFWRTMKTLRTGRSTNVLPRNRLLSWRSVLSRAGYPLHGGQERPGQSDRAT